MRTNRTGPTVHARRRLAGLLAALALGALAAGCAQETPVATYPEATAGSVPDPDDETTTTTGRSTTTSRAGGTTRGSTSSTTRSTRSTTPVNPQYADYCRAYVEKLTEAAAAPGAQELELQKRLIRELAEIAPAPVKADLTAYSAYAQKATSADAMKKSNLPPELKAADERLEKWHETNCGR